MKTDAEKKKGFSPEEKKQREGELLVWVRNNWWAKRHRKKVTEDGGWLLCIGYRMVLPRMDAYKEHIEEYANQYLEAAMLGELEKAKLAYTEGHSLTKNIGEMVQEEEPDWVDVEARIRTAATKYAMLGALKALDANCHNMFKRFGMLTYSIAMFLNPKGNLKFTSADTGQLIFKDNLIKDKRLEDQVWYHFTQQVVMLNKKSFGKADDPTAVDNDIPVDALDSQIQLSKNANMLSQHCEEAVVADYLLTALMFKFGQPHNMVAELANEWYNILLAKQEIEQPFKFRVYYNMKEKQMMPARLQCPATEETNDPELQYPTVHSNTASCVTDWSEVHAINTPQHTNTLTTQPSATARKRVTEEERLAQDAEQYWVAEGSKRQSKKLSHALNR
ncbi:hypothetical protein BDN71DRAFT_1433879 [Pleurotus eryngii]|uniref:Uncharacterized protein n=1 Tax=Pleurotus eryngii TaxID=5323 RepID=A0A9P5ZNK0_PLEER|nr:hypothetical protein BDN71DRAFT_1433879 [Pleurotus eryngii]